MIETVPEEASQDLIARARAGSTSAFERIYRIHVGRVYGVCLRILGDQHHAEDATQLAFIRSWIKLPSYRGESSFSSWIYRLAVNVAINELKAAESIKNRHAFLEDLQTESVGKTGDLQAVQIDLEKAIAALPPGARVVFVLREIEGLSYEDIAEKLSLSSGTCRAQVSRARKLLKEALGRP